MLVCRPSAVTFLLPFGVWMMMRDTRRALLLTLQSLLCYLPWAWMNRSITGSLFGPSMSLLNQEWTAAGSLSGILFSPARGVFVYQPWLFLLFALRRSRLIPWWPLLVSAVFLQTLLVASWPMWWGGHCYGSRLLTETVPLLGLLLLKPLDNILAKSWGCWLAGTLVVLGLMLHLPGSHGSAMGWNFTPASIDEQTERLWDWRYPPFLFDWQR